MWNSILATFAKVIAVPIVLVMSLAGYNTQVLSPAMATQEANYLEQSKQVFGNTQPFAGNTYNLAGSGVSNSASTIILTSLTIKQTGQPIQTSDLVGTSGTFYITLEPGSNTKQEIVGCTGVSQGTASASLTGCTRGLSPIYPYTASTTLQFTHAGGTSVIFSDPPQLFNQYAALGNTQTITGGWTFSTTPSITNNAINPTDAVNYQTLLNTSISGAGTSTESSMGISQLATNAQVSAGTASSTQGRPLVIKSGSATSTCQVAAPGVLAASSTTGKLAPTCFDATQAYTFTAPQAFTNGLISTASSTYNTGTLHLGAVILPSPYFGGTGIDGALSISSGTTTIALTGAVTEKDYTSISITGTGSLNFIGTTTATGNTVILRSQNACTFTSSSLSMIDLRWMGGGTATAGAFTQFGATTPAGGGGGGSTSGAGNNGAGGTIGSSVIAIAGTGGIALQGLASSTRISPQAGNATAGGSGNGGGAGGAGGLGAGGLYIECGGAFTFTTGGFLATGANGIAGGNGASNPGGSGGGGGGGGNIMVDATSISSDSGTYNTTGGTQGSAGTGTPAGNQGGAGASGTHLEVKNTYFY